MAILLHPTKDAPQRYRVWDRATGTQKYFPLTPKGKKEAEAYEEKVVKMKKARALNDDLAINKLFNEDGSIKGMRRATRVRNGYTTDFLKLYANLKTTELSIGKRDFDETYRLACQWLMKQYDIEENFELRKAFKKARKLYWTSPLEEEKPEPLWKKFFN